MSTDLEGRGAGESHISEISHIKSYLLGERKYENEMALCCLFFHLAREVRQGE